ncbi:MAG: SCO family protein, partial [Bacteroidota bacterium]
LKLHLQWCILILSILCFSSCENKGRLPFLGKTEIVDGKEKHHTIPDFKFVNQDGTIVTNETFSDQIYITDFFFTSCPTICPKMTQQMKRLHEYFVDNPNVAFVSHTIDVRRDTVGRLKRYAENIGITDAGKWHFVTGEKDAIYEIADEYFNIVIENSDAPQGFDHSGRFILVDKERHVRAFADGTNPDEVDRLRSDVEKLLKEY